MKQNNAKQLTRNIPLAYLLAALLHSWFWIAVWVLYYLRFTDYAGIGFLEMIMVLTNVLGEIPTGAIADLLGKKITLTVAFLFGAVGNLVMGLAPEFNYLVIGVVCASVGYVLTSGTFEALVYDTLVSTGSAEKYQKIISNISSSKMVALAFSSVVGGVLYSVQPGLPFLLVALSQFLAAAISLLLVEPPVDSEVFSLKNYLRQTKAGFTSLFSSHRIWKQSMFLIGLTAIIVMNGHVLIDLQLVALGWSEVQLGIISAAMFLASAAVGQLSTVLSNRSGVWVVSVSTALSIGVTMAIVPGLGVIAATIVVVSRNGLIEVFGNSASEVINSVTVSKYRATTLSTYSMLSNSPYIIGATVIGRLMDAYSVHEVTAWLGAGVLVIGVMAFTQNPKTAQKLLQDNEK